IRDKLVTGVQTCALPIFEDGDHLRIAWLHRSMRYGEKLATPDTSVGDLIGDVDPIRVAEGRTLGDPETIHFGLVPRTNRGIFARSEERRVGKGGSSWALG